MTYYINTVAIDYLSLTTYSAHDFLSTASAIEREYEGGLKTAKRMQYEGFTYKSDSGSVFCGIGNIGDREHHLIQASGMLAHRIAEIALENRFSMMSKDSQWSCTRIDIQLTIEHRRLDANALRNVLKSADWPKGVVRKLTVISSESDTLYIGSRASAVMFRVYQKSEDTVRLELEIKRDGSRKLWEKLIFDTKNGLSDSFHKTIRGILFGELRYLPDVSYLREYRKKLSSTDAIDVSTGERSSSDVGKRYKWFVSLIPSIKRLAADSDYGRKVIDILIEIIEESGKVI
jgi:hypothetical protein